MIDCCIAISSTIFPRDARDSSIVKSVYSGDQRLAQTQATVASLRALGYSSIYLFDNSGGEHRNALDRAFPGVRVKVFDHYQYDNKGISETFLLLEALRDLPEDRQIIKISGRYQLAKRLEFDADRYDLAARIYQHEPLHFRRRETMATRCYSFRNKAVYRAYLLALLEEMYAYSSRIVGFGSLRRFLINQFFSNRNAYSFMDPSLSVEAASINVMRNLKLRLFRLESIGLAGFAGTFQSLLIED